MDIDRIAKTFVDARRRGTIMGEYPGESPQTLADAYAIQDSALAIWNRPVGGWKVGKIGPPLDERLGANRLIGPIFADLIVEAGKEPAEMPIFAGGFAAAEAEFMIRLAPRGDDARLPQTDSETLEWIDEVRIGMEIASSPYPRVNDDGPCVTISDHGNNLGAVIGPQVPRDLWGSLNDIRVTLEIEGEEVGSATAATMLDGPLGAVRFLLGNLRQRAIPASPGWWTSSGAITGVHSVEPGQSATAMFDSVGIVAAVMTPFKA